MEQNGKLNAPDTPLQTRRDHCARCGGLMIVEQYVDVEGHSGEVFFEAWRCMNFGEVVDRVVLENRSKPDPPSLDGPKRRKFARQTPSCTGRRAANDRRHDAGTGKTHK